MTQGAAAASATAARLRTAVTAARMDVTLLAILLLAFLFRLYDISVPLIDAHSWRQVTNADIARHFASATWNLLTPQVSWGGTNGVVGMEFPLLQYVIGLVWRVGGESELVARLVTVAFSLASVWLAYELGRRLFSDATGRGAAFLMAVAPSTVYFGRSVLSDTPMVTFMLAALVAWDRWLDRPSGRRLAIATTCTALAGLVKLPGVIVGVPIVALLWCHRRWAFVRDRSVWMSGLLSVAAIAAWYWHADAIGAATGLTQAIFRPSGVYGLDVGLPLSAYETVSHWSHLDVVTSLAFHRDMLDRFWGLHLTPFGFVGAVLGWWLLRGARFAAVPAAWLAAGVIFLLSTAEGQHAHEFHQLPLVPPLALYFGAAAAPLFDGRHLQGSWTRRLGLAACLTATALMAFRASPAIVHLYRPENLQAQFPSVGGEVRSLTQEPALIVAVDYEDAGTNSPMFLYYAHRQGWSFDVHAIGPDVVEHLRTRFGARYFVTMEWYALGRRKPDLVRYLLRFKPIRLKSGSSQVRMFDLTRPLSLYPVR